MIVAKVVVTRCVDVDVAVMLELVIVEMLDEFAA